MSTAPSTTAARPPTWRRHCRTAASSTSTGPATSGRTPIPTPWLPSSPSWSPAYPRAHDRRAPDRHVVRPSVDGAAARRRRRRSRRSPTRSPPTPAARRDALAAVAARYPRYLDAWAELGDAGRDDIERYAYYRVGYHRGLDALRANGWRGSGYVRWSEPTNRGFLRSLAGLGAMAEAIGEADEAERIATFLVQLDPDGGRRAR